MIALTFDDGPNDPYTRQILDVLAEYGAKATFFVIGKWVRQSPEIVREVAAAGHEIGNHTETHPSGDYGDAEFLLCDEAIENCGLKAPDCARAPFGKSDAYRGHTFGVPFYGWDVHGGDWSADSVEAITEPIFAYLDAHKSGIVLLHDGYYKEFGADRSKTVEATRRILERYKSEKFVTIGEYLQ